MNREIVNPDHENGDIDRKDAKHEDEDRVGVVVKIMVGWGSLHNRILLLSDDVVCRSLLTFSRTWREALTHVANWTMHETR